MIYRPRRKPVQARGSAPARPRVSVILPVFNGERYLAAAIGSVLGQTYANFELIVVNDGSQDRSPEIARSFADPRIRILDNAENIGLPHSLNRALQVCTGRYVARQDADDVSEPRRLAQQVAFLERNPGVALVGTWYTEIDVEGNFIGRRRLPCKHVDLRWALLFYSPFVHSSVMFRTREVLETAGAYSEEFPTSQDYEFWLRIASRFEVANLPAYLVRLRTHAGSITAGEGATASRGHRLRLENAARLLAWDSNDPAALESRFAALSALASGFVPSGLRLEQPGRAVDDLVTLLARFSADANLTPDDAARFDRAVRAMGAQALLVLAVRHMLTKSGDARDLVRLACRASGAALVNPRTWGRVLLEIWKTCRKGLMRLPAASVHERGMNDAIG